MVFYSRLNDSWGIIFSFRLFPGEWENGRAIGNYIYSLNCAVFRRIKGHDVTHFFVGDWGKFDMKLVYGGLI